MKPAEGDGVNVRSIATDAHWQLGKRQSYGGWFNRVLEKLLDEFQPISKEEWLECIARAHIKNQMLQVHGFSPHQFVFRRNPHIPQNLLSEPQSVIANTASLIDDGLTRTQAMRIAARMALTKMQNDRSLRMALLARPRRYIPFQPGDLMAYWRNQKWIQS